MADNDTVFRLRCSKSFKRKLAAQAKRERRTMSNLATKVLLAYCAVKESEDAGLPILRAAAAETQPPTQRATGKS